MIRPPSPPLHALAFVALLMPGHVAHASSRGPGRSEPRVVANVDVTGVVTDSTNGQPVESAEVTIANAGGAIVANTTTSTFGGFTIHYLGAGTYSISVHLIGYRAVTQPVTISATATPTLQLKFALAPVGMNLDAVQVVAPAPSPSTRAAATRCSSRTTSTARRR